MNWDKVIAELRRRALLSPSDNVIAILSALAYALEKGQEGIGR